MAELEILMTKEEVEKMEQELEVLKSVNRQEVADRIKVAIGFGDLSENAEYVDAKEEQAFLEGKILQMETTLRNARIVEEDEVKTDVVNVGVTVKVRDMDEKEDLEFVICSTGADPMNNRVSTKSPVGSALLGRKKGQTVEVKTPSGVTKFKILSIQK